MTAVPHLGFIVAAYALSGLVVVAMIASILMDYRALKAALARLEAARADKEAR
jgi:heme exporter protein CcmD